MEVVQLDDNSINKLAAALAGKSASNSSSSQSTGNSSSSGLEFKTSSKEFGKAVDGVTGFLGSAGSSVSGVAAGMTGLVPILSMFKGAVGGGIGYLENTNAAFQSLTKVGAGFNGDLGALRAAAADSRLSLDDYTRLIGTSSEALAGLGAGVDQGAKRFAQLSRAMFEDGNVIGGMMNLGYTIGESNEFLMEQAGLLSRQARLQNMDEKAVTAATLQMAENMAVVAKITGKNAEQQRNEMADQARDGKNIAANRALEAKGIKDATQTMNLAFNAIAPLGPQAQAFLQDLNQAGAPLTPMTRQFEGMNSQTASILKQIDRVRKSSLSTDEKTRRIEELAAKAQGVASTEFVNETNRIAASLGQVNDIGLNQSNIIADTEKARLGIEQARADIAKERGVDVSQVSPIEAAEKFIMETKNLIGAQSGGGAEGQEISATLNQATIDLADTAASVNKELAKNISANTKLQDGVTTLVGQVAQGANAFANLGLEGVRSLPGASTSELDRVIKEQRTNFKEVFGPITTNNSLRTTIENFDTLTEGLGFVKEVQGGLDAQKEEFRKSKAIGGGVNAGTAYKVGEQGPETFLAGMDGAIIPNMKAMLNRMPDIAKTMQDEMAMMGAPMSKMAQEASAQMQNSTSVEQKLDILNQTMLQLVNINSMQARTGEKQLKGLRHTGNLMSGLGRA
jgi:hypothetical protein